ncbi:MAG: hypothetical protein NT062_37750 [Proteobacteria bacterium]|nr:hypothetical protein [Pseudomonadota bacterium]
MRILGPQLLSSLGSYVLFTSPFVLYILARWRAHREPTPDAQLGIKLALGYLATVGLQVALLGGVTLLYAIITKQSDDRGTYARVAFGLLLPALAVWGVHRVMLGRTNEDAFPAVRQLLAGYNLLIVGLLGFVALVATSQALFAKGSSGEGGRLAVATLLVYLPAWGFHGWRVFADRTGARMPPPPAPLTREFAVPVVAGTLGGTTTTGTTPTTPTTPGLPPLGGGSFPPIGG